MPKDLEAQGTPFSIAFAAALEARRMSLSELKRLLDERGVPIAIATLSYWRSATRHPDLDRQRHTIAEIEDALYLEPGELSSLAFDRLPSTNLEPPGATNRMR